MLQGRDQEDDGSHLRVRIAGAKTLPGGRHSHAHGALPAESLLELEHAGGPSHVGAHAGEVVGPPALRCVGTSKPDTRRAADQDNSPSLDKRLVRQLKPRARHRVPLRPLSPKDRLHIALKVRRSVSAASSCNIVGQVFIISGRIASCRPSRASILLLPPV